MHEDGPNHGGGRDEANRRFVTLLTAHHKRIYGLIRTLVVNVADAEDLTQATTLLLWEKFDEYEPDTDFAAWAFRIARNLVRNHWRKQARRERHFDDRVLEVVADEAASWRRDDDLRIEALRECMATLPQADRTLIQMRYAENATIEQMADAIERSGKTVYRLLGQIHAALLRCVQLKLRRRG